jgi:arylsulfatase A-like enzyme
MLNRRQFIAASAALAAPPKRKPNIVWIMGDDLGYSDVGCYGQKTIRTPNIDRLAREGTRFTDAYSGCTVCAPSRSVLMTGQHMGHTSVRSNPGGVPLLASDVTVGEVLKQAGYATGCFGKWGLGDIGTDGVPWKQGFDEFFGYLHQAHAHLYYPQFIYDNDREFPLKGNGNGQRVTYSADAIAARSLDFIRRHRSQPFFCYIPSTLPHWELLVPEDSLAEYRGRVKEDQPFTDARYANQAEPRAAYAGMVSRLDRHVGQVAALLQELQLTRETLLIFTSDNGGAMRIRNLDYFESYGPFRGHKQNLYEGGIRVPMIARWPGRVPADRVSDFPWMFEDFLPTAAALAGAEPPKDLDGMSVLPTLLGQAQKSHDWLYWELPRYNGKTGEFPKERPMQALRMGYWKAVRPTPNAALELYDLKTDPGETRDVSVQRPDILREMDHILLAARTDPRPQKEPPHGWWNIKD